MTISEWTENEDLYIFSEDTDGGIVSLAILIEKNLKTPSGHKTDIAVPVKFRSRAEIDKVVEWLQSHRDRVWPQQ